MDRLRGLLRRLRTWLRPGRADRELEEELSFHVAMETDRLVREGQGRKSAHRSAMLMFGGAERYAEAARDARGSGWLDGVRQDVRLALRLVVRNPQFTAAVVLTLALGIGANTAIFSVVDAVLLRAWPFADVDRLVMVWETDRASGTRHEPASWPDVVDLRERSRTLEGLASMLALRGVRTDGSASERVAILGVTPGLPAVLGIEPLIGRGFAPGSGMTASTAYALLSERYWRTRFGSRRDVVGTAMTINGRSVEVAGVLPRDADLGIAQVHARADYSVPLVGDVDMWVALEPSAAVYPRQTHPFLTIGRLREGVALQDAQSELAAIMEELETAYPENASRGVNLEPYEAVTFGPVQRALFVLLGAVGLVLLVACVNVANLLLARTAARTREVAVRRALGASGARIRRQFLIESAVLTVFGAAGGVLLAYGGLRTLIALAPPDIPRLAAATLDARVLIIATGVSVVVCMVFGMAPLLEARRVALLAGLRAQGGRNETGSREHRRFRSGLVVAEVALAVLLVVAAGLLIRSFRALTDVDPGYRAGGVLQAEYELVPASRYPADRANWPNHPEIHAFNAEFLARVRALPGVRQAALATQSPLDPGFTNSFVIVGRETESADFPEIRTRFISPGYLATLAVPLVAGRDLAHADVAGAEPVALINMAGAQRYFPDVDPVDQHLRFWGVTWRIVGVIGDERFNGLDRDAEPAVYAPIAQAPQTGHILLARTDGNPAALAPAIRNVLNQLDPGLALSGVRPLDERLRDTIARPRFVAALLGLFAAVALILALVGIYGVLSYDVAQRTPEVGIRLALGSTRAAVVRLVLREGLVLAATGTVIGLAAAAAVSRAMAALLFGVDAHDALTFAVVTSGVIALAVAASVIPARRAARAEPMTALRAE